jgi:hypothetical protein
MKVVDDQLTAAIEKVLETPSAVRAVKCIVLFNLDHGKPASLGIHTVVLPGEFLLVRQKFLPLGEPLLRRNDSGMWDGASA